MTDQLPNQPTFSQLVLTYKLRSGLSYSQIEKKSGVPSKTITSWAKGLSKRPRDWRDLVKFGIAVNLKRNEMNEVLELTGHPAIENLRAAGEEVELFTLWEQEQPPIHIPRKNLQTFLGRHDEIKQVKSALKMHEMSILQGMGGIGKSSLAAEVADQIASNYSDGVLWGDLRTTGNDEILDNWAAQIGLSFPDSATVETKANNMWGVLSRKRFLIVLDDAVSLSNAKQLLPPHRTRCGLLITTRKKQIAHGIATDPSVIISMQPMKPKISMDLFAELLGDTYLVENEDCLKEIADLLGHLPLALNIFARRQRSSTTELAQVLERLQDIRRRLKYLKVDDEAVRTAFEQSWEQLDLDGQTGFKMMGVFEGRSFGAEAFFKIGEVDLFDGDDILDQLQDLFLVESRGGGRFQQHTLLAAWSQVLLLRQRDPYLRLADTYFEYVSKNLADESQLQAEWPNIMAGMRAAHRFENGSLVMDYLDSLEPYWLKKGYYTDARKGYQYAVEVAEESGDFERKAFLELAWGNACIEQSDYQEAWAIIQKGKTYFTNQINSLGIGKSDLLLAEIMLQEEDFKNATRFLQAAWRHFQEIEDVKNFGASLYRMSYIYIAKGEVEESIKIAEDALKTHSTYTNSIEVLRCLTVMAFGNDLLGNHKSSAQIFEKIIPLLDKIEDHVEIAEYYYAYSNHLTLIKEFEAAESYGKKSLEIFRNCGDRYSEANALNALALCYIESYKHFGDPSSLPIAQENAERALDIFQVITRESESLTSHYYLARILYFQGKTPQACERVKYCLTNAIELNNTYQISLYKGFLDALCQ